MSELETLDTRGCSCLLAGLVSLSARVTAPHWWCLRKGMAGTGAAYTRAS